MLHALDVIRITDVEIRPPGPKMVVCICPELGLFYRINSYDEYPISVSIPREPDHLFLKWDSNIECSKYPLELDDAIVESALKGFGGRPYGRVAQKHAAEIMAAIDLQRTIAKQTKDQIRRALGM